MKKNDLRASPLRSIFLSATSADESQAGIFASVSPGDKNEPAIPGKSTRISVIPPVMPNAIFRAFQSVFPSAVPLKMSRRARIPSRGMQNSAITRIIVTALNLLYPGKKSMNRLVRGIKFLPQASIIDNTVADSSHHFSGPLISIKPKNKKEEYYCPDINRSVNPWLAAPVHLKL